MTFEERAHPRTGGGRFAAVRRGEAHVELDEQVQRMRYHGLRPDQARQGAFSSIADVRAANNAAGSHYWDRDTVRATGARGARLLGGCVVVEQTRSGWQVALFTPDGRTSGAPVTVDSREDADEYARAILEKVPDQ